VEARLHRNPTFCYSVFLPRKPNRSVHAWSGFLTAVVCAALVGCAAPSPPQPPSLELPQPVNDLKAVRKGDKVVLSWTQPLETTDGDGIRFLGPTHICRSLLGTALDATLDTTKDKMTECGTPAAEVTSSQLETTQQKTATNAPARVSARYTDTLPADWMRSSKAFVTYAIESLNTNHRGAGLSNQVRLSAASTQPPPTDFHAQLTNEGVVLTWTGPLLSIAIGDGIPTYFYRAYRVAQGSQQRVLVGETIEGTAAQMRLVDHSLVWEKTYEYRINVTTRIRIGARACPSDSPVPSLPLCKDSVDVEGEDSAPLTIVAHDIFPPAVPTALQAVFSGAEQNPFIDLTWNANTDSDLAGYNVYRRAAAGPPVKINTELVKTPAYRDTNVVSGQAFFYSIAAVDVHSNESARSEEASEQVP
jgi:hypothetical protein